MSLNKLVQNDENFYYRIDSFGAVITGLLDKNMEEIRIPSEVGGAPVRAIGKDAFAFCCRLKKAALPDSVVFIEKSAFKGCENLREAVLSAELESIGPLAFCRCSRLRQVTISDRMTAVEINSFSGCHSLERVRVRLTGAGTAADEGGFLDFAVASEGELLIWIYLRAVLEAVRGGSGGMRSYDEAFMGVRSREDMFRIAVYRLQNPCELLPEAEKVYRNTLNSMVTSIIREDDIDRLNLAGQVGAIAENSIDRYIELAGLKSGRCLAYLLEYKQRNDFRESKDFSL